MSLVNKKETSNRFEILFYCISIAVEIFEILITVELFLEDSKWQLNLQ